MLLHPLHLTVSSQDQGLKYEPGPNIITDAWQVDGRGLLPRLFLIHQSRLVTNMPESSHRGP